MLTNLNYNFNLITLAAVALFLISVFIWWLKRRKKTQIDLPIIRILQRPAKKKIKINWVFPPWVFFIFFVLIASLITFTSFKPSLKVEINKSYEKGKIHIYTDWTVSVSAVVSTSDYKNKISRLVNNLLQNGYSITIASSNDNYVTNINSSKDIEEFVADLSFHLNPSPIAVQLPLQLRQLEQTATVIIISDQDQYSWEGFNWQGLSHELQLFYINLSKNINPTNLFISNVSDHSGSNQSLKKYIVEITRNFTNQRTEGELLVKSNSQLLFKQKIAFDSEKKIELEASWHSSKDNENITFSLELPNKDFNSIELDDQYNYFQKLKNNRVLILEELKSDIYFGDTSYHLTTIANVLGFSVYRSLIHNNLKNFQNDLIVFLAGHPLAESQCKIDKYRPKNVIAPTKIWLAPESFDSSFSKLCGCLKQIIAPINFGCENVGSAPEWSQLLAAIGGKQIGGSLGNTNETLAYRFMSEKLDLIALTTPLKPSFNYGISFDGYPKLIKSLLSLHALTDTERKKFEDYVNVDYFESLLVYLPNDRLPAEYEIDANLSSIIADEDVNLSLSQNTQNAKPVIAVVLSLLLLFLFLEGVLVNLLKVLDFLRSRNNLLILLPCVLIGASWEAKAQLQINALHSVQSSYSDSAFTNLSKEIDGRTSMTLKSSLNSISDIKNISTLKEPWLWIHDIDSISDKNGIVQQNVWSWLQAGGTLILQQSLSLERLEKLTGFAAVSSRNFLWTIANSESELFKSFYLMQSLPECQSNPWHLLHINNRIAIIVVPYNILAAVSDNRVLPKCNSDITYESLLRTIVNIIMVTLTLDYKNDQIHLPAILKRIR